MKALNLRPFFVPFASLRETRFISRTNPTRHPLSGVTLFLFMVAACLPVRSEDGYELWLRYRKVEDASTLAQYRAAIPKAFVPGKSPTAEIIRSELRRALPAILDRPVPVSPDPAPGDGLVIGTFQDLQAAGIRVPEGCDGKDLGDEGYVLLSIGGEKRRGIVIAANTDVATFYGAFHFLRILQTRQDIGGLRVKTVPRIRLRLLNHWDNLDGSVERGYAGRSLWKWEDLPEKTDPRVADYARACASVGINGTVLNNVNASAESLTPDYLKKTAALADQFRPYGIRVFLSARFSAPVQLGGAKSSDPRNPAVAEWWKKKADEIYGLIFDFGGFVVKANSEGQPGPQEYGATHADGANMLADALAPLGGIVMWRAFVYDTGIDADRAKCAFKEFTPLDGRFRPNALVQVKNGPIDFQPREPFHPLFGAMPGTPLMMELQITQEYLGQSVYLTYLAPLWKEVLESDTYGRGPGTTVASVVDGSADGHTLSGIAGVANTGSDRNWCGHPFGQANWYAFGRLAWDHTLDAGDIAEEWIRSTWSNDQAAVDSIRSMMLGSWEACVNAMTPLGLCHMMKEGHHYGPDPALDSAPRPDWNSVYYHRADSLGLGFERGFSGSGAVSCYRDPLRTQWNNPETCPEKFLLFFHHVPWNRRMESGRTLWEELRARYDTGVESADRMRQTWKYMKNAVDPDRYRVVEEKLNAQEENVRLWREVCVGYFRKFAE
jgi:alpha-glucuronidase